MAAEHAPPPGGGAASEPAPSVGDAGTGRGESAAEATRPSGLIATDRPATARGDGGATQRGRRLLPSGPALEHAPLLLGLDAAGGEHPQGGEHPDDENLVGRVWGCVCGWRGTVRDVSTRPFHPRVGDGGGLRRQRLARSDRGARAELDAHVARNASASTDPPKTASPDFSSSREPPSAVAPDVARGPRPRSRRRRLTVPRDTPLAIPLATAVPTAPELADKGRDAPPEHDAVAEPTVEPDQPTDPDAGPSTPGTGAAQGAPPGPEPAAADADADADADAEVGERTCVDLLENAVARAEAVRAELAEAEAALTIAVTTAREDGLSWRTIGRATGLGHHEAAARWGPPGGGPSL